ncbi:MAG TPA: penicillin acylase family protein [Candidatus Limnocylindrales bacterium]|nr:penicillin acylase family protein [Candidatus Limnocylindrales bacterium]
MRRFKRVLLMVATLLLVAVIAAVGLLAAITARALPQASGSVRVPGLAAPAVVVRDETGIAHITADSTHDLFFAQGYVHASERMWQMEVWRHIGAGRLAELFGESQLDTDRFIRTLGWRAAAQRDLDATGDATRAVLDAYTDGVNAWLDGHRDSLGLAFLASSDTPEPWTDLDTMAWGKVQAWNLGGNFNVEVFRYLADAALGDPARTDELFPAYREDAPVITPSGLPGSGGAGAAVGSGGAAAAGAGAGAAAAKTGSESRTPTGSPATPVTAILDSGQRAAWRSVATLGSDALALAGLDEADGLASDHGIGSNNWVVAPALSVSGGALLANDPHLGISMPSIWYINGLHCRNVSDACPYDVAGVSFPGVPGVVLGHNARIAWGATNVGPDVQDLVLETVDPADPGRYLHQGESLPFEVRHEEIRVKGGETVALDVRSTNHGPILNDVDDRLADAPLMALRWAATVEPDHTVEAILGLNTAANFDDFRASLSLYGAPSQNFVYADVDGHIGYQLPGYIPVRSNPNDRGDRPVRGDDGSSEWTGKIPFEDLPWQLDPEPGWIVTANNAAVDAGYPHFVAQEWDPGYRAERIIDLLNSYGDDGLTTDELRRIQVDSAPLRARDIVPLLADATPATEDGATIAARIGSWDGACGTDSTGCAAWSAWEYRVMRDVFDDDLGSLARDYVGSPFSWVELGRLLDDPSAGWWDDATTPDVIERGPDIVARAMDEAGSELRDAIGSPDRWSWGRLHTATFREATLGQSGIGPLEWYFNDGPHAVPGTAGAIDNTYFRFSKAYPDPDDPASRPVGIAHVFDVTNMPSYRLTVDMSDLDGARIVITTGQAGNPFDRHYNDQIDLWRSGGSVPLPFTAPAIERAAVSTLTLTP